MERTDRRHGPSGLQGYTTVIAPGGKIIGSVKIEGNLHLAGEIEGKVMVSGYVIVMPAAVVNGDIRAQEVYLGGLVKGDIDCERLHLYEGGVCAGEVTTLYKEQE